MTLLLALAAFGLAAALAWWTGDGAPDDDVSCRRFGAARAACARAVDRVVEVVS